MPTNSNQKKPYFKQLAAIVTAMFTVTAGAQTTDDGAEFESVLEDGHRYSTETRAGCTGNPHCIVCNNGGFTGITGCLPC